MITLPEMFRIHQRILDECAAERAQLAAVQLALSECKGANASLETRLEVAQRALSGDQHAAEGIRALKEKFEAIPFMPESIRKRGLPAMVDWTIAELTHAHTPATVAAIPGAAAIQQTVADVAAQAAREGYRELDIRPAPDCQKSAEERRIDGWKRTMKRVDGVLDRIGVPCERDGRALLVEERLLLWADQHSATMTRPLTLPGSAEGKAG